MKRFICLAIAAGLALAAAGHVVSDDKTASDKTAARSSRDKQRPGKAVDANVWMKAKQKHAQNIFAGLTEGDFKKIEQGATMMYGTGIIEKWMAENDFEEHFAYEGQVNAFEYSLKELARNARQKDVDGALNAYVMMSQTCVRCHRLIRDADAE